MRLLSNNHIELYHICKTIQLEDNNNNDKSAQYTINIQLIINTYTLLVRSSLLVIKLLFILF